MLFLSTLLITKNRWSGVFQAVSVFVISLIRTSLRNSSVVTKNLKCGTHLKEDKGKKDMKIKSRTKAARGINIAIGNKYDSKNT